MSLRRNQSTGRVEIAARSGGRRLPLVCTGHLSAIHPNRQPAANPVHGWETFPIKLTSRSPDDDQSCGRGPQFWREHLNAGRPPASSSDRADVAGGRIPAALRECRKG